MNAFWKQLRDVIPSQYQVTHAASPRVMGAFDLPLMFMSTHYLTTFVHPGVMAQTTPFMANIREIKTHKIHHSIIRLKWWT